MHRKNFFRRLTGFILSAVFILSLSFSVLADTGAGQASSLDASQAVSMSSADEAIRKLTEGNAFQSMTEEQRLSAAARCLNDLSFADRINGDSVCYDDASGILSFRYTCGVLGGIMIRDFSENDLFTASSEEELLPDPGLPENLVPVASSSSEERRIAKIFYAFDNTLDSTRYSSYVQIQQLWNEAGLPTILDTEPTVQDFREMADYDVCIISTHGAYFTYTDGPFWKQKKTEPILILNEKSTWYKDLFYGLDLILGNVIKINGRYCIDPSFFDCTYFRHKLHGNIVISETCEFMGIEENPSSALADAILNAGARTVIGFRNNVYAMYARGVMFYIVSDMMNGKTAWQAMVEALGYYGADDLIWYNQAGGRNPHARPSYPILTGSGSAAL